MSKLLGRSLRITGTKSDHSRKSRGYQPLVKIFALRPKESAKQVKKDAPNLKKQFYTRFREVEIIHSRWAMLGVVGLIIPDLFGIETPLLPQLAQTKWLPVSAFLLTILSVFEAGRLPTTVAGKNPEKRVYPGKNFDFLGITKKHQTEKPFGLGIFSSWVGGYVGWLAGGWWFQVGDMTEGELENMKQKELNNGRLAMVAFLGCYWASAITGQGPITMLLEHIRDPTTNSVLRWIL